MIFTKRVLEKLDYVFDFTSFLDDDTIVYATVTSTPSGLSLYAPIYSTTMVKQYVVSGIDGTDYTLTCTIDTEFGRKKEMDLLLRVKGT
jgi:hypothetical protein